MISEFVFEITLNYLNFFYQKVRLRFQIKILIVLSDHICDIQCNSEFTRINYKLICINFNLEYRYLQLRSSLNIINYSTSRPAFIPPSTFTA